VEPVADLRFLEVAKPGVEPLQVLHARKPRVLGDPRRLGQRQGLGREVPGAAGVGGLGERQLVQQHLEVAQRPVALGPRERRGEVVEDDGLRPPLGLRPLAGSLTMKG
jgi:hypothetical protein